jgi:hypothetical protein
MKQKNIALIIVVVFVSGLASLFLSRLLISGDKNRREKVEVVQPITADFNEADKKYYNDKSIDPTRLITIGDSSNNQPFNKQ